MCYVRRRGGVAVSIGLHSRRAQPCRGAPLHPCMNGHPANLRPREPLVVRSCAWICNAGTINTLSAVVPESIVACDAVCCSVVMAWLPACRCSYHRAEDGRPPATRSRKQPTAATTATPTAAPTWQPCRPTRAIAAAARAAPTTKLPTASTANLALDAAATRRAAGTYTCVLRRAKP